MVLQITVLDLCLKEKKHHKAKLGSFGNVQEERKYIVDLWYSAINWSQAKLWEIIL